MERHILTITNDRGNEVTTSHNMIRFNTDNPYTEFGQRISVVQFNDHQLFMLDHDRGLTYLIHGTYDDLNQNHVMYMYNINRTDSIEAEDVSFFYALKRSLDEQFTYIKPWKIGLQT